jgi:hypothetical protein
MDAMPMAATAGTERATASASRRSRRIGLTVPIEVCGKDVEKSSFTVSAAATNLNRNGAMLYVNRDLAIDSVITLTNSHGIRTLARVVAQTVTGDLYAYGIELPESDNVNDFWGINFPSRSR